MPIWRNWEGLMERGSEMDNGVVIIKQIKLTLPTKRDILCAMLSMAGCKVSSIPNKVEGNESYSDEWEYFNPERVEEPSVLPEHWKMVYEFHNQPDMRDCRELRYRYVHCPEEILPQYPRVPCKGIFCLVDRWVRWNSIQEKNLIHIGNEF